MSSRHYCLKWNNFQSNILNAFESLQNTEDLTDVTLTCEGFNFKAHKFILSACSPYFRTVFKENPCSHPIVILKDVSYTDLAAIINFMYHGEVLVSEEQLSSFLQTAKLLQVSGLNNSSELPIKSLSSKRNKRIDSIENLAKKLKVVPSVKSKGNTNESTSIPDLMESKDSFSDSEIEYCPEVNENVEVLVTVKSEQQGSILEAALEPKPSSILERSLTSHPPQSAGKSPPSLPFQHEQLSTLQTIPEPSKAIFIPRKPPEEKRTMMSSSSPIFDRPSEILQQSIKVEGESYDNIEISPADDNQTINVQISRNIELQAHHSSQCGNCPHCGKVYSNQSALKYHVRLVHSDLTNMYCCHLCPEAFDYREGYKKHMVEVHCVRN